jgi:hypothetical protein
VGTKSPYMQLGQLGDHSPKDPHMGLASIHVDDPITFAKGRGPSGGDKRRNVAREAASSDLNWHNAHWGAGPGRRSRRDR